MTVNLRSNNSKRLQSAVNRQVFEGLGSHRDKSTTWKTLFSMILSMIFTLKIFTSCERNQKGCISDHGKSSRGSLNGLSHSKEVRDHGTGGRGWGGGWWVTGRNLCTFPTLHIWFISYYNAKIILAMGGIILSLLVGLTFSQAYSLTISNNMAPSPASSTMAVCAKYSNKFSRISNRMRYWL